MELKEEIAKFFEGDIENSAESLDKYSRDASLFYLKPSVVVFPKHSEDIKKLVNFVNQARKDGRNISLTARAAGTDMTGGPLSESIVVEMTRYFNKIKKVGDDYAVVEPGVYYRDFEKETLAHNLLLPSFPASRGLCTVGGMVANNSGGEKTLRFGKTELYVRELKMILRDGNEYTFKKLSQGELNDKISQNTVESEIYKNLYSLIQQNSGIISAAKPDVTKNSAGYYLWNVVDSKDGSFDINKVITGSQGTFGIITEITFNLVHPAPANRVVVVFLNHMENLSGITEEILKYSPESLESYDDHTFKLAMRFFPEIITRIQSNLFKIVVNFMPEAWMLLTGGIPKLVLLAKFTGETVPEAEGKANTVYNNLRKKFNVSMRVTQSDTETNELEVIRRESFTLLRKHMRGMRTAPFIDDFAVNPKYLAEFLEKLHKIMDKYTLIYTVAGHVGDGNLHIIPLMKLGQPDAKEIIEKLSHEVYDLVLSYKGTITAEHNDGLIRTPFLKQQYGEEVYGLFVKTKNIFDPDNIFNPNKKVGTTMAYAMDHVQMS